MSVHERRARKPFEVRWTEAGKQRSRSFTRRSDAERFDERVKLLKENGRLHELDAERKTLAEYGAEWWPAHSRNLEHATKIAYLYTWNTHILPHLGPLPLAAITPRVVERWRHQLEDAGAGAATVKKSMAVLQAALGRAVVWGYLQTNPVAAVPKPSARPAPRSPITPAKVEVMRRNLRDQDRYADAALVCTLAYSGLRPEEALALTWGDIGHGTIRVDNAIAFGESKLTKTERARAVDLLAPLREDLAELRVRQHHPGDRRLIWPKASDRDAFWRDHDYRNWRSRRYRPAAQDAGIDDLRPYTLRASFASLLIAEGHPVTYVAEQLGHSVETCLRHYALLFKEFAGVRIDAVDTIRRARRAALAS